MNDKSTVIEMEGREVFTESLTELLRKGARDLIEQAVEADLQCRSSTGVLGSATIFNLIP